MAAQLERHRAELDKVLPDIEELERSKTLNDDGKRKLADLKKRRDRAASSIDYATKEAGQSIRALKLSESVARDKKKAGLLDLWIVNLFKKEGMAVGRHGALRVKNPSLSKFEAEWIWTWR